MHYTGMAAFETEARLLWDPGYVAVSLLIAAFLSAVALRTTLLGETKRCQLLGALLLTMAICGHHFTAMAAISLLPDPLIQLYRRLWPRVLLPCRSPWPGSPSSF